MIGFGEVESATAISCPSVIPSSKNIGTKNLVGFHFFSGIKFYSLAYNFIHLQSAVIFVRSHFCAQLFLRAVILARSYSCAQLFLCALFPARTYSSRHFARMRHTVILRVIPVSFFCKFGLVIASIDGTL
jgi:hypothetical protein